MRVCVVGNSHIAALKKAWDARPDASFDVVFFGAHRVSLKNVRSDGHSLVTDDAATRRSLEMTTGRPDPALRLDSVDCFVLHALINPNWVVPYAIRLARHAADAGVVVSSGLLRAVVEEIYERSVLAHMLQVIRSGSDAPILVSPQPYLSQQVLADPVQGQRYLGLAKVDGHAVPSIHDAYDATLAAAAVEHSFELLGQPKETIVDRHFTDHSYCLGSLRLSRHMDLEHPADDYQHMNEKYGALVLRDVFRRLSALREHGKSPAAGTAAA